MALEKTNIAVAAEKCTGCLNCQLICSFTYAGSFNPSQARIIVESQDGKAISFADNCIQNCHLCTRYCAYGAITRRQE